MEDKLVTTSQNVAGTARLGRGIRLSTLNGRTMYLLGWNKAITDTRFPARNWPHTTLAFSPPSFSMNKENKGHLHAIKNRLSPSSSKPPSRLGSPIPPDESSDKDQQHSWSLRKFFGKPAIAPTQSTSPIPESSLSTYPSSARYGFSR